MSDSENCEVDEARDDEDVLKALKDLRQNFNLIRSQHILSEAVHLGGSSQLNDDQESNSDADMSMSKLEEVVDRLCIQECAVQFSRESDTIRQLRSSGVMSSKLQELLTNQLKQESQITSLATQISKEYNELHKAQDKLMLTLEKYMNYEKKRSQELKEYSLPEDNERLRKQLKEIRFMQLIIPAIISQIDDFTQQNVLIDMCKEIRDPILSVEDLQ